MAREDWARGPLPEWREVERCNNELGDCLMPFERLAGRRWEWRLGGINDPCWRPRDTEIDIIEL